MLPWALAGAQLLQRKPCSVSFRCMKAFWLRWLRLQRRQRPVTLACHLRPHAACHTGAVIVDAWTASLEKHEMLQLMQLQVCLC